MIFLSAFGSNFNSGGEYVTKILKDYYFKIDNDNKMIVIDSNRSNTINADYKPHSKLFSISIFIFLPFLYPQFIRRFKISVLKKLRREECIVLNFTQTFIYSLFLQQKKKHLVVHDVLLQVELRKKRYFLLPFIYFWEYIFFNIIKNCTLYTLSHKDKQLLIKYYFVKSDKIKVVSLVDLINLDNIYNHKLPKERHFKIFNITDCIINNKIDVLTFGIIGAWNRDENFNGLKKFIKETKQVKIKLIICGSGIERLELIDFKQINVEMIGFVDDITFFFNLIDALIIPLEKGAGVKIKVLQALSYNVPCIGTTVAFEGIDNSDTFVQFDDISKLTNFLNYE
jgi:hypothetical protein